MARKVHRLSALATAALLALAAPVEAKPIIAVTASFDHDSDFLHRDSDFRRKLEEDLGRSAVTPEQFVAQQFINAFEPLGMFAFKRGGDPTAIKLILSLSSGSGPRRWPANDVELSIWVNSVRKVSITLFQRAHCGRPPCSPQSLADPAWYQQTFSRLIRQWPRGLFKGVVLTETARYEMGGRVRTRESVSEFGQRSGELPTALFELRVGHEQIPVALCLDVPGGQWRGLGKDQGRQLPPEYQPTCWVRPVSSAIDPGEGTLTLVRVFP